jgi:hypothetical protein
MAPDEKAFNNIDGTPTMYIRGGSRQPATFRCTFAFYDTLVSWVRHLRSVSAAAGYGALEFITSAGAYVNKSGQHGLGTAFDLDEVQWVGGVMCRPIGRDHSNASAAVRRRYYAVDATTRTRFRWVLDAHYNAAHQDHIHMDFGGMPPLLGKASSDTFFVQAVCNEFMGAGLAVDGIWGPLTQAAFDESRRRLGTTSGNPHTTPSVYATWLNAVSARGFAGQPF